MHLPGKGGLDSTFRIQPGLHTTLSDRGPEIESLKGFVPGMF